MINPQNECTTYTYDNLGRETQKQMANNSKVTHAYDDAGRVTGVSNVKSGGQETTNTWNDENRRTRTQTPSGGDVQAEYRWDGLRYEKEDSSGTTRFIYDGQNYLFETTTGGSIVVAYTVEPQTYGKLASRRASSSTRFYHTDALGSTRSLTNSSETVTDTYLYDAWGDPITSSGSLANPFRWVGAVGYYYDDEVGTYYVRARNYSRVIARWLSQDPLFWPTMNELSVRHSSNLTAYVFSNPTKFIDASGLAHVQTYCDLSNATIGGPATQNSVYLRFDFQDCNWSQRTIIMRSLCKGAKALREAIAEFESDTVVQGHLDKWFGTPTGEPQLGGFKLLGTVTESGMATVEDVLSSMMKGVLEERYQHECETCTSWYCKDGKNWAYILQGGAAAALGSAIHYCPRFFGANNAVRAAKILHEISHLAAGTEDLGYLVGSGGTSSPYAPLYYDPNDETKWIYLHQGQLTHNATTYEKYLYYYFLK